MLNCGEEPIQSEKAADLLQSALQQLPDDTSLYCGMSMVHHTYEEAETAFHEAQISADCLPFYPKTAVLSFERVQYQPSHVRVVSTRFRNDAGIIEIDSHS